MELNSTRSYHASAHAPLQMTPKSRFDLRNNLCLAVCSIACLVACWFSNLCLKKKNVVELKEVNSVISLCNSYISGDDKGQNREAYDTEYSQAVTHPSTNPARQSLTSVIEREPVFHFFLIFAIIISWLSFHNRH